MHVVLISVGTDGDIFPYVGLGAALRSRGHTVSLVASAHYEGLADAHGFPFHALVSAEENHELFEHPDFWDPLKTAPLSARWGLRFVRRQYDLLSELITRDSVLVANPGVLAASLVHEKFGVPWANLILQPWMIPSSIAPPAMPYFGFLSGAPRPVWKVFWRGIEGMANFLVSRELNAVRRALGLKPMRRIFKNWLSKQLLIGMFPDWYGPPQEDWPSQIQLVGFPKFDDGFNDVLSADLLQFCQGARPPVVFTFGTGMAHSAGLFQASLEACAMLGIRGLFLTKYRNQLPNVLPPGVVHSSFAPFQELFPLCAAVVHHGGIGTVANAMAAGVPQLIHPLCFDQIDNGLRTRRLGGGDCLGSARASGKQIATALAPLLTDEARARCGRLMTRFDKTNALTTSAELVEKLSAQHSSKPGRPA